MARIGRFLPAVFVTGGNPYTANDAPGLKSTSVGAQYDLSGQLGAVLRSADGTKELIYARISTTGTGKTPAVGSLCYWWSSTATSTTDNFQWTVDTNTTAGTNAQVSQPAGVLQVAGTRGNYVWLLRKHTSCVVASTTTYSVARVPIVLSSTQTGDPTVIISTATDPSVGNTYYPQIGILNSVSTAATVSGATSTSGFTVFMDANLNIE